MVGNHNSSDDRIKAIEYYRINIYIYIYINIYKYMIPKVVYFTHESKESAQTFAKTISYNKKNNSDLVFKFYDDKMCDKFIRKHYPDFYKFYIRIHPDYGAAKADIFRVLILHHNGGIYIDIKTKIYNIYKYISKTKKSFYIGTFENEDIIMHYYSIITKCEYMNWFIATGKRGVLITKIIEEMYQRLLNFNLIKIPYDSYYLLTGGNTFGKRCTYYYTGPILFTYVIKKNKSDVGFISDTNILIYNHGSTGLKRLLFKNYKNTYHFSKNSFLM
jgi:inositol phosphorylceramide mannosyltransferase catalytic subunit